MNPQDVLRTGVTVIQPRADEGVWTNPVHAAIWALNGAGELTSTHNIRERGILETPIALGGTSHLGAMYEGMLRHGQRVPATDSEGR